MDPAVKNGFTVIVTGLDVAGLSVVHGALEVSTQVTALLFAGTKV